MTMKQTVIDKAGEVDEYRDLAYDKLDVTWSELVFFSKVVREDPDEVESKRIWVLTVFAAEKAFESGMTRAEFLEAAARAYDEASADEDKPDKVKPLPFTLVSVTEPTPSVP